jgi:hypothetical protein
VFTVITLTLALLGTPSIDLLCRGAAHAFHARRETCHLGFAILGSHHRLELWAENSIEIWHHCEDTQNILWPTHLLHLLWVHLWLLLLLLLLMMVVAVTVSVIMSMVVSVSMSMIVIVLTVWSMDMILLLLLLHHALEHKPGMMMTIQRS